MEQNDQQIEPNNQQIEQNTQLIEQNTQQIADNNSLEQIVKEAVSIQNLVNDGTLNSQQGQYYMSQLAQKTLKGLNQDENAYFYAFQNFEKEKPNFFNQDGRSDVLNYLKNSKVLFDKDEINQISDIIEKIEKCAIERFVKAKTHEEALNNENEVAKSKLNSNAQKSASFANKNMVFTREQIGKMSGAEFTKYEPLIYEQLKQGKIL